MTTQVAVMNLSGIAVASDTVVTSTIGNSEKVIGGKSKIYFPGHPHKFVVLHNGAVEISGIPIHLHLHAWFESLSKPLTTLNAYVDSYRSWSISENRMVTKSVENWTVRNIVNQSLEVIRQRLESRKSWFFPPEGSERKVRNSLSKVLLHEVHFHMNELNELPAYPGLTDSRAKKILEEAGINSGDDVASMFNGLDLTKETLEAISSKLFLAISRAQDLGDEAELVFVGFGIDEPFPHKVTLTARGIYGGTLQAVQEEMTPLDPMDIRAQVISLAQGDAMQGFFRGQHYSMKRKYHELISSKIEERWGQGVDELVGEIVASEVEEEAHQYSYEKFIQPFMQSIEAFSPKVMAELAEFLVGLQVMTTYKDSGTATVGGVIEVVTIDRIQGVVVRKSLADSIG